MSIYREEEIEKLVGELYGLLSEIIKDKESIDYTQIKSMTKLLREYAWEVDE